MIIYLVGELCCIAISSRPKGKKDRWCFEGGWRRSKVVKIESWAVTGEAVGKVLVMADSWG